MKYDFTTVLDRMGNDAIAVEFPTSPRGYIPEGTIDGYSIIPMWVADMNFMTAPSIVEAIQKRAAHASFGYFSPRAEYYDAIISWQKRRYGVDVTKEQIGYENGVLGALSSALTAFTEPGEKVFLHGPSYIGFLHTLESMNRPTSVSELVTDEQGIKRMDFDDIEKHFIEDKIRFAIFCSPHNPAGRVWERWEIEKFVELCVKHNVLIFSDEIWCDLVLGGRKHIPTHSVSEDAKNITITAYAPTKTFSLAGLVGSYHVIFNKELKEKVTKAGAATHYNGMNVLSQHALIGAYSKEGEEWLDELLQVLTENVDYACNYISRYEGIEFSKPQGTYMLFLDCTKFLEARGTDIETMLKYGWKRGVIWQDGRPFGKENSIRINLGLPLWQIKEAIARLEKKD